jgi:hypothetical protein
MADRPILMAGDLVRAVLDDRKTTTRRLARNVAVVADGVAYASLGRGTRPAVLRGPVVECPFARTGDVLWVREAWALEDLPGDGERVIWRADRRAAWRSAMDEPYYLEMDYEPPRWRPSLHMPRWAARLFLDVTRMRVQRVQDITEEEAKAEGVPSAQSQATPPGEDPHRKPCVHCGQRREQHVGASVSCHGMSTTFNPLTYRGGFAWLWDSLATAGSRWADNPFVWAVDFKRREVR